MIARNKQGEQRPAQTSDAPATFAKQAKRLGHRDAVVDFGSPTEDVAVEAKFVTGQDPVIETASGSRLPAVPVQEALNLNNAKARVDGRSPATKLPNVAGLRPSKDGTVHGALQYVSNNTDEVGTMPVESSKGDQHQALGDAAPPSSTNPLFPPLPLYGPNSITRYMQSLSFRLSSAVLSFAFLMVIVLCSAFSAIPKVVRGLGARLKGRHPNEKRPFHQEEKDREASRKKLEAQWVRSKGSGNHDNSDDNIQSFPPLVEGGPDLLLSDPAYYARRVGLDIETFKVQTEDGFILELLHILVPSEDKPAEPSHRGFKRPDLLENNITNNVDEQRANAGPHKTSQKKYPVLLMHGLLQSAGAFCCTDDDSLAFYLAKSGYDVWLGNNRCGFKPEHNVLSYADPRMWAWNIRQMGVMDLPALVSRVLENTGFEKLGLVAHSQGTTETFVALAKEQRPELGEQISVFCALAPAAYSGPLINKVYFKFMRLISPSMFRLLFGIHAFIPFMMRMHRYLPARFYGSMGYLVFSFLFNWTDTRWDKGLRNRFFQFSPVYVSSESMRWWLGRECFAKHKCILSTKTEGRLEDEEDRMEDEQAASHAQPPSAHQRRDSSRFAWYDERAPPMAFWVCGNDDLVDGRRLLRRFDRGREPHVKVVHQKIIEEYEHLDVIWAVDSIDQVGKEVREVIWKTVEENARKQCRIPEGCSAQT